MNARDNTALEGGPTRSRDRSAVVDAARGAAVLAMVVYHTAWDLSSLAFVETDVIASPGWRWFARSVAAAFLVLVGIGLVLAHRKAFRPGPFARRMAVVALAAVIVTVVTTFVFPDSYIFFGVLHNIALSSLVAIPVLRWPGPALLGLAAATWATPLFLAGAVFDPPLLAFLGLGTRELVTNDYVPIFPWTGFVFAGMALAASLPLPVGGPGPAPAVVRALGAIGRRSLLIYLLHQPLIFGALWGLRELVGPNEAAEAAPFMNSCVPACIGTGQTDTVCRAGCGCTADALKREGLWRPILSGQTDPETTGRASALARSCIREAG